MSALTVSGSFMITIGHGSGPEVVAFVAAQASDGTAVTIDRDRVEVFTGLWATDGGFTFSGKHYEVLDSPGLPKPAQRPGPPVIIGGGGAKRTPNLAARLQSSLVLGQLTRPLLDRRADSLHQAGRAEVV